MKLKGIDGGLHKRWSMWFNSMQSEEPYQGLKCHESSWKKGVPSGTRTKMVHGCRQLMPQGVGLSPATSATLVFSCHRWVWNPEQIAGEHIILLLTQFVPSEHIKVYNHQWLPCAQIFCFHNHLKPLSSWNSLLNHVNLVGTLIPIHIS